MLQKQLRHIIRNLESMEIPVVVQLRGRTASERSFTIDLDPSSLDQASAWCGSYDILQMGQHFDAYVITPRTCDLPSIPDFPVGRRYTMLPGKLPAPSVQGNIGESIAALMAVSVLGCMPGGIAHVKPGRGGASYKAPDLLLRVTPGMRELARGLTNLPGFEMPEWLPCEAKCRRCSADVARAMREAEEQLEEFWCQVTDDEKGFGVACCFIHQPPQEIRVRLFLPDKVWKGWDDLFQKVIDQIE